MKVSWNQDFYYNSTQELLQWIIYTIIYTLCIRVNIHNYTVHCTLYTVQCTMYSVQYVLKRKSIKLVSTDGELSKYNYAIVIVLRMMQSSIIAHRRSPCRVIEIQSYVTPSRCDIAQQLEIRNRWYYVTQTIT